MDKSYYDNLRRSVERAKEAALTKAEENDFGTCNFDRPIVELPKEVSDEELVDYGVPVRKISYGFFEGCYEVCVPLYGQGLRRTKMALAAAESMCKDGYSSCVWYQAD